MHSLNRILGTAAVPVFCRWGPRSAPRSARGSLGLLSVSREHREGRELPLLRAAGACGCCSPPTPGTQWLAPALSAGAGLHRGAVRTVLMNLRRRVRNGFYVCVSQVRLSSCPSLVVPQQILVNSNLRYPKSLKPSSTNQTNDRTDP